MPNPIVAVMATSAASSAYSANKQSSAAKDAANTQAAGVEAARSDLQRASAQALPYITGATPPPLSSVSQQAQQPQSDPRVQQIQDLTNSMRSSSGITGKAKRRLLSSQINDLEQDMQANPFMPAQQDSSQPVQQDGNQQQSPLNQIGFQPAIDTLQQGGENALARLVASQEAQQSATARGYNEADTLLAPLASNAMPAYAEQGALLGMFGNDARGDALSRISDPLVDEQERALMRNFAGRAGGVGLSGNLLSALADQTRRRSEANLGTRLSQLASYSSPALNALQNLSQQRLARGQSAAGIEGQSAANQSNLLSQLAAQISGAQQQGGVTAANTILGQGSQLAQLSQNLGTAQAGYPAYRAQNSPALVQGLQSGIGTYLGLGGTFNGTTQDPFNSDPNVDFGQSFNW